MLSRVSSAILSQGVKTSFSSRIAVPTAVSVSRPSVTRRAYGTLEERITAKDAWQKSCYFEMDFAISEDNTVYEAVQRFAAYDIGCLVTTDQAGNVSGVVSERDYINKVALLGRTSKETKIKEISTRTSNLITASPSDSVDACMNKMMSKGIRHLPLMNNEGKVIGMLSIKDLVRAVVQEKERTIKTLSDFALGKGSHYIED